eukprot:g18874.t1
MTISHLDMSVSDWINGEDFFGDYIYKECDLCGEQIYGRHAHGGFNGPNFPALIDHQLEMHLNDSRLNIY